MKSNESFSIWHRKTRLPALVLLVDSEENGLWFGAARELVAELRQRLPEVPISSATAAEPQDLQSALSAAAFLGAPSAIVVNLWGQDQESANDPQDELGDLLLHRSESPPDVEAIVASYQSALLALAPTEMFLPCN